MNALDRVIGYFAPQTGMKRARARNAIRIYEGASVGRRSSSWKALHTAANSEIQLALRPLRDRSRDLARNTPHAPRMLDILGSHVVGTGIVPVSATGDDKADRQVGQLWDDWIGQSDVTGLQNFYAIQALAVRSMVESGEVVGRFIDRPLDTKNLAVPMQFQLLESDYIDQFRDGIYGDPESKFADKQLKKSRLGVGLGDYDRRVGLWLWPYHPGEITTINLRPLVSEFIPSEGLVHMFRVLRPGQVRGVPWFAPILTTARDLSDFLDAVNVKARVEACFAGFIVDDGMSEMAPLFDQSREGINQTFDPANPEAMVTSLEPGMLKQLRQGQDVKFAQPTSNTQIEPVLMFNLQAMAAAVGCTYDQVTGDLRQANYSSLRAGKLDFWRLVSQLQKLTVIPMLCQPTWRHFISRAILAGRLKERRDGYPCQWVTPAREAVDPIKDLKADIADVRAGRMTPQQFIASRGDDWRRSLEDRAAFFALCDELGLTLDIDPRRTNAFGGAPDPGHMVEAAPDPAAQAEALSEAAEDLADVDDGADRLEAIEQARETLESASSRI
jgi:lambda family phage portal protein